MFAVFCVFLFWQTVRDFRLACPRCQTGSAKCIANSVPQTQALDFTPLLSRHPSKIPPKGVTFTQSCVNSTHNPREVGGSTPSLAADFTSSFTFICSVCGIAVLKVKDKVKDEVKDKVADRRSTFLTF
jgi:hypothetical protein